MFTLHCPYRSEGLTAEIALSLAYSSAQGSVAEELGKEVKEVTVADAEAAALLGRQRQPVDKVQHGRPVDCVQGFIAAQADQRGCGCIGGCQMRQLPGAAPESAAGCLAGPQKVDHICMQRQQPYAPGSSQSLRWLPDSSS